MKVNERKPILTLDDVKRLVDVFYEKVRKDELLAPIFDERIQDRWPQHLERMYSFWQTVLLGEHTYYGAPFVPHATLPVEHEHFAQWLTLFFGTVDEMFEGPKAEEAKWRANRMAEMFEHKIKAYREQSFRSLM